MSYTALPAKQCFDKLLMVFILISGVCMSIRVYAKGKRVNKPSKGLFNLSY